MQHWLDSSSLEVDNFLDLNVFGDYINERAEDFVALDNHPLVPANQSLIEIEQRDTHLINDSDIISFTPGYNTEDMTHSFYTKTTDEVATMSHMRTDNELDLNRDISKSIFYEQNTVNNYDQILDTDISAFNSAFEFFENDDVCQPKCKINNDREIDYLYGIGSPRRASGELCTENDLDIEYYDKSPEQWKMFGIGENVNEIQKYESASFISGCFEQCSSIPDTTSKTYTNLVPSKSLDASNIPQHSPKRYPHLVDPGQNKFRSSQRHIRSLSDGWNDNISPRSKSALALFLADNKVHLSESSLMSKRRRVNENITGPLFEDKKTIHNVNLAAGNSFQNKYSAIQSRQEVGKIKGNPNFLRTSPHFQSSAFSTGKMNDRNDRRTRHQSLPELETISRDPLLSSSAQPSMLYRSGNYSFENDFISSSSYHEKVNLSVPTVKFVSASQTAHQTNAQIASDISATVKRDATKCFQKTKLAFPCPFTAGNSFIEIETGNTVTPESQILMLQNMQPSQPIVISGVTPYSEISSCLQNENKNFQNVRSHASDTMKFANLHLPHDENTACHRDDTTLGGITESATVSKTSHLINQNDVCTQNPPGIEKSTVLRRGENEKINDATLDEGLREAYQQATRTGKLTPIIKQELRRKIMYTRCVQGKGEIQDEPESKPIIQLTEEEQERNKKKRERNRLAASRCRKRKQVAKNMKEKEVEEMERRNTNLKELVNKLNTMKSAVIFTLTQKGIFPSGITNTNGTLE